MQRWLVYCTSKRAGFQKTACLGLKCIFLCALSSKQGWNGKENSKPLWIHLIFTLSPLRFEWFNHKAVNLGRFTQNLVKGYLKESQTPKDVRQLWLSLLLASNTIGGQGTFPGFSKLLGNFFIALLLLRLWPAAFEVPARGQNACAEFIVGDINESCYLKVPLISKRRIKTRQ